MAWTVSRVRFDEVESLRRALDCPEAMAWVLVRRGLADPDEARDFLRSEGDLEPPEAIPGIAEAADRLARAIRADERVVVHGDYDCDGICSTAILLSALRAWGVRARPYLPSRFTDGYGVNLATVERLADEGCDLLVTVDCGTTAVESLTRAAELGIESIVCDHHLAGGVRPPSIIANPALGHGTDALPAVAGVTFKLVQALAARLGSDRLGLGEEHGIDLVALATVADAVPLIGENRRLVARGLAAIHTAPSPGIAALCAASGVSPRNLTARDLGWNLAPAINASGRMAHPEQALDVLLGDDSPITTNRAKALWDLNMQRREVEQRVTTEAIEIIEASGPDVQDAPAIVVAGDGWHEGVVGIVASRLVERFGRPSIVVSLNDGVGKGSGRSVPGVDLHALVAGAASRLDRWGGHAGAIGLQVAEAHVTAFRQDLVTVAQAVTRDIDRARVWAVDAVVGASDLSLGVAEALDTMQPFGTGNPEIRFAVPAAVIQNVGTLGRDAQHLQVRLRVGGAFTRAIGWRKGRQKAHLTVGARGDAVVQLGIEKWQDMIGPRVTLDSLDTHAPAPRVESGGDTPTRVTAERILAPPSTSIVERAASRPPRGVRDLRDRGSALATIAALSGADDGVVIVTADVAGRRVILDELLRPERLGVDRAVVVDSRRDAETDSRVDLVTPEVAVMALVDYDALSRLDLSVDVHLVALDPPADAAQNAALRDAAQDRWLHLLWGDDERGYAERVVIGDGALRDAAAQAWRALADGAVHPWGPALDAALMGDAPDASVTRTAAALRALQEIGRIDVAPKGVQARADAPPARLEEAPTAQAAIQALEARREYLRDVDRMAVSGIAIISN